MVFSSLVFLFYFLPVVLGFYFIAPPKGKNLVLFTVSLVFYAWGEPVYLFLMLFSILINYLFGLAISRSQTGGAFATSPRLWLILACTVNLALLGFFKYGGFLIENINAVSGLHLPALNLPLPLGISFYTFQAMSYIIDLYRGKVRVQRSLIAFGTYVALFPQLIAGPIVRFQTIADELTCRRESLTLFSQGVLRFVSGLSKKVLLANSAGAVFDQIIQSAPASDLAALSTLTAWIGILAFTFQIYFDFSGYSDMAIGLGNLFGFHFPENFNYPYISKSITDFWRRWHMTLSSWFKEYVYIPLGGNKKGILMQLRNIAVVWALTGIWHGASWNFLVWGVYFGILLIAEKLFLLKLLDRVPVFVRHVYAMFFVVISWVIFSIDSLPGVAAYLSAMFSLGTGPLADNLSLYLLENNALFFLVMLIGVTPIPNRIYRRLTAVIEAKPSNAEGMTKKRAIPANSSAKWLALILQNTGMVLLFLLVAAYLVSSTYNPFLYFRF